MGCSPLGHGPYARAPSPEVYKAAVFGVRQGTDPFRNQNPKSVTLQLLRSRSRLDCGQFRQVPAITSLDWLFTPNPKSKEQMHLAPLLTSTGFYPGFIMSRISSTGFGSHSRDSKQVNTSPLAACAVAGLLLSLRIRSCESLSSPPKCTPWHVIRNGRQNAEAPCLTIFVRFQAL